MKLYEGRVGGKPLPLMDQINRSLPFDIRLLACDLATNRAWAGELCRLGIFSPDEHRAILAALDEIGAAAEAGAFSPLPDDEDVHTLVERQLTEKLGPIGARIHTGRSRNDQVVCDLRLYTRAAIDRQRTALQALIALLADLGECHAETLMAGTTHLQPALPITLGQFLCSLGFALTRDLGRLEDARARVNLCPLGSGAMAGSGFPVDRQALAAAMGFQGILDNSIDAISDRDFCQETAFACATLTTHLSRYAEQFTIWANPLFGYVRFSDDWSTGSSMMPQKRNPDAMELVRGKAARVQGNLTTLLTLTKGLPLTYAKDLQEDKEPLFDALDTALLVTEVFTGALASAQFRPERLTAALSGDMLATDLADALARAGLPFRQAHEQVARLVTELERDGGNLAALTSAQLASRFPLLGPAPKPLDFAASVAARIVAGGTAPARVHDQVQLLRSRISDQADPS